jgi:hypothetical protein
MHQMGYGTHQVFFERIVFRIDVVELNRIGHHLFPNGVPFGFDRGQDRGGYSHRIGTDHRFNFLRIDTELRSQLVRLHNALGQYPSPFLHS